MGAPQRLSAQHRAEMAQVLHSLGNVNRSGTDLAIDKDLYESSRHGQSSDRQRGGATLETDENIEFLKKIHAYNRALQQRAQEEAWNNRANVAATTTDHEAPTNQKRIPGKDNPRLGQSAPSEVRTGGRIREGNLKSSRHKC